MGGRDRDVSGPRGSAGPSSWDAVRPPEGADDDVAMAQSGRADERYNKDGKLKRSIYEREMERLQEQLVLLQYWVQSQGLKVLVIFEGRGSAGKGGVIKSITERTSPRTVRVVALPKPTERQDMDLAEHELYVKYSMAKDITFQHTDTKQAPWWVVPSDDKRAARLNCIEHLLSQFDYVDVAPEPVELPSMRAMPYVRPPMHEQTFVPRIF